MATYASQTTPRAITSLASQNPDIRKIRLYRNGDENFYGKELVFNKKQMRGIEHLLQMITDHVELDRGARSIHTPDGGSKVQDIDDVTDKGSYVVVGNGKFKKLEYDKLLDRHVTRLRDNKKHSEETDIRKPLKPVESNDWHVPSRIRNTVIDVVPIYVYRNGDDREPAKRIILTHRMMTHWSFILAEISQYVQPQYTATHHLFRLDGERVVHKRDIQAYSHYVAVGYRTPFKKLNYGQFGHKPVFSVSPRVVRRRLKIGSFPHERPRDSVLSEDESLADSNSLAPMSSQSEPTPGMRRSRHNRLARKQKYMIYNDGTEVLPYRHQQPLPAIQDSDRDGGPFKAKEDRAETRDAKQVDETKHTQTDKPQGKKGAKVVKG